MICPICNKNYKLIKRPQGGGFPQIYCSEKCRAKAKRARPNSKQYQLKWSRDLRNKQRENGTRRDYLLKRRHGISEREWKRMFQKQKGRCAICRTPEPKSKVGWHTDHDHHTGKVRGILCENCNRGLGMYHDDISFLRRAAAYLGVHQGIISSESINKIISPFHKKTVRNGMSYGSSIAGYDLRIDQNLKLAPGQFSLASSMEYFDMPNDMIGLVYDKSSYARKGLQAFNTVIEPCWKGYLTLELVNHNNIPIILKKGDPIVQVIFHALDQPTEKGYEGKYQNQARGPQPAILEK